MKEVQTTIPKGAGGQAPSPDELIQGAETMSIALNGSEELKKNGFDSNDFSSAYANKIKLKIIDLALGADFSFVRSVEVFVEADGLPKIKLASGENFEKGLTEIGLNVEKAELKPYVIANQAKISVVAKGRQPDVDTKVKATFELGVTPDLLGLICSAAPIRGARRN